MLYPLKGELSSDYWTQKYPRYDIDNATMFSLITHYWDPIKVIFRGISVLNKLIQTH